MELRGRRGKYFQNGCSVGMVDDGNPEGSAAGLTRAQGGGGGAYLLINPLEFHARASDSEFT